MINNKEKGFALVMSLVLLMVMTLMGGALIVIAASDHRSNNIGDEYQQTFYVAETALYEGEKYLLNQFKGPYDSNGVRVPSKRGLPKAFDKKYKVVDELTLYMFPAKSDVSNGGGGKSKYIRRKMYRNAVTKLCKSLSVPEIFMSSKKWSEINFKNVPLFKNPALQALPC